jgi:hypothetical protein
LLSNLITLISGDPSIILAVIFLYSLLCQNCSSVKKLRKIFCAARAKTSCSLIFFLINSGGIFPERNPCIFNDEANALNAFATASSHSLPSNLNSTAYEC